MTDILVWISGASSGIGAALVETLPYHDAHIVDISQSGVAPNTEHLPADLSDPAAWSALGAHFVARLTEFGGSRVVFIHAAATLDPTSFAAEMDAEAYRRQVLLNTAAPQALGQAFLQAVQRAGHADRAQLVILTRVRASGSEPVGGETGVRASDSEPVGGDRADAASNTYEGSAASCAGKAAVDMWVRTTGAEQRERGGCTVLAIGPGNGNARWELMPPEEAAAGIWQVLDRNLDSGTVTDLGRR